MSGANHMSEPSPNGNGNGNSNGRPFRDDLCLAIVAIPGYSLTDCAVLLWVAKRTFWGKAACTCLPSRIARELGGKIAVRTIQCSLRRFELDGLTVRSSLKSGPYPNRETALTEKFWETIQSVLADIEPRRYGSACTQFCAPYARTAHGDARFAHGDARFAHGDARFAHGDARFSAPHIEERARSVPSTELETTTTDASTDASLSFLAALSEESGGTGGPYSEALDPARLKTAVRKLVSLKLKLDANDPGPMDPATAERVIREATGESTEALRRVAWAIKIAGDRASAVKGKGPAKLWRFVEVTLEHWLDRDRCPPSWPEDEARAKRQPAYNPHV